MSDRAVCLATRTVASPEFGGVHFKLVFLQRMIRYIVVPAQQGRGT